MTRLLQKVPLPDGRGSEWIAYAAAILILLVCVLLLVRLRRAIRRAERAFIEERSSIAREIETLRSELAALGARLAEVEQIAGVLVAPEPPRSGLNLAGRSEALRRLRKGEAPGAIAAALGVPVGEVALLGKVQKILLGAGRGTAPRPAAATTETAPGTESQPSAPAEAEREERAPAVP